MNDPWRFQRWAFEAQTGNPVRKAVLSMLAMMADGETGRCEAKQCTLAAGVEATERAVRGHLKTLEAMGLIARRPQFRRDHGRRGDEFLLLAPGVTEWPDGEPAPVRPEDGSGGSTGTDRPHPPERNDPTPRNGSTGQEQTSLEQTALENENAREPGSDPVGEVWAHYQRTVPNGSRRKLGPTQRRLIKNALKVRSVHECCGAITALCESDYHVENGYLDVKYALLGGGRNPSAEATIDRWCAARRPNARDSAAPGGSVTGGNGRAKSDYNRFVIREDDAS